MQTKVCEYCGTEFPRPKYYSTPSSDIAWGKTRFCSLPCSAQVIHKNTFDQIQRFNDRYIPEPMSGCWLWLSTLNSEGYGLMSVNGVQHRANRLSYAMHKGPIPAGLDILHTCDNPPCVNPDHLYAGTKLDNSRDKVMRKRSIRGTQMHCAKLTPDLVREIRASHKSNTELAAELRVSRTAIYNIRAGKAWEWVE